MTFIKYQHFNLRQSSLALIDKINAVIDEFGADGYTLTLRQIYYQLVQANDIPNTPSSYDNLGVLVKKGRLMGLISWDAIEDRNRAVSPWLIQPNQRQVLDGLEQQLAYDLWTPQRVYLEAWVEKDAQANVVERPCAEWRVPFMACRGYMSTSEIYNAGNRFREAADQGKRVAIIHLGDHDPSGWDMSRDNEDRVELIAGFNVEVRRIALMTSQVRELRLPPQPAKVTDKRFAKYMAEYGSESWELDALRPQYLANLLSEAIKSFITDMPLWERTLAEEAKRREPLAALHSRWPDVLDFLAKPIKPESLEPDFME